MTAGVLSLLLLAAAPLPAAERAALDASVERIYAPYSDPSNMTGSLDAAVYSAATTALLERWKRSTPSDEVDELSDGDWFCQCQDFDAATFRATVINRAALPPDKAGRRRAQVSLRIAIGWDTVRRARLIFVKERGEWRLDDMYTPGETRGFKRIIRDTIAANEKQAAQP